MSAAAPATACFFSFETKRNKIIQQIAMVLNKLFHYLFNVEEKIYFSWWCCLVMLWRGVEIMNFWWEQLVQKFVLKSLTPNVMRNVFCLNFPWCYYPTTVAPKRQRLDDCSSSSYSPIFYSINAHTTQGSAYDKLHKTIFINQCRGGYIRNELGLLFFFKITRCIKNLRLNELWQFF